MRRKTTVVKIGNLLLSAEEPVVIQSMLNTSTMDTAACVEQAIRIIEAGGQLVRITAQGVKEAENLKNIRAALWERGYTTPISADIHFNPAAAAVAAHYVEKVRINPGNFADKRATFQQLTYSDEEYAAELEGLKQKFLGFLDVCREYHTAVRIGTNHGSLSDRIMSRYGNTPAGMVEATMEYLRICRDTGFEDVVISLKSSDCRVMVEAVRLLVKQMEKEGIHYPLHLGVTEAGEGEDGRVRSAVGIGCLLNEGLGDTIRVSLTEAPEQEISVARTLVALSCPHYDPGLRLNAGDYGKPVIVADIAETERGKEVKMRRLGFEEEKSTDSPSGKKLRAGSKAPEIIYTASLNPELAELPSDTVILVPPCRLREALAYHRQACPLYEAEEFMKEKGGTACKYVFVRLREAEQIQASFVKALQERPDVILVLDPPEAGYQAYRTLIRNLQREGITSKIILKASIKTEDPAYARLWAAAHTGGIFIDRAAYGLWISAPNRETTFALELSRDILQSVGLRRYKTEFVSCPGCGRTLYNLEDAVTKVKKAFSHLERLKIAIMGCVVNGPGEMGDADYGYVGAGNGKVNLYKGRQRMRTAVPEEEAIVALEQLIRDHGDWKERN